MTSEEAVKKNKSVDHQCFKKSKWTVTDKLCLEKTHGISSFFPEKTGEPIDFLIKRDQEDCVTTISACSLVEWISNQRNLRGKKGEKGPPGDQGPAVEPGRSRPSGPDIGIPGTAGPALEWRKMTPFKTTSELFRDDELFIQGPPVKLIVPQQNQLTFVDDNEYEKFSRLKTIPLHKLKADSQSTSVPVPPPITIGFTGNFAANQWQTNLRFPPTPKCIAEDNQQNCVPDFPFAEPPLDVSCELLECLSQNFVSFKDANQLELGAFVTEEQPFHLGIFDSGVGIVNPYVSEIEISFDFQFLFDYPIFILEVDEIVKSSVWGEGLSLFYYEINQSRYEERPDYKGKGTISVRIPPNATFNFGIQGLKISNSLQQDNFQIQIKITNFKSQVV